MQSKTHYPNLSIQQKGQGGNQPGAPESHLELVAELRTEPLCVPHLFAWQSLGFSDHCTLASTCLGLLLSSIGKWGHKWTDKSAAGAGRQAQNLDWTEAQLTQLCPAALTLCPGSLSSLCPFVLVLSCFWAVPLTQVSGRCPLRTPRFAFNQNTSDLPTLAFCWQLPNRAPPWLSL